MWTAVYLANSFEAAQDIKKKLTLEGFVVKIEQFSKYESNTIYKILAPEFEAEEVQNVIHELGL
ncbi:hypothetical protein [Abyssisolibacter fermentans]|uniref:hypothetical protein n=1 Tax=Abyssisolibacter fermentans TaxID=1766203 RepID=UPI00082D4FCC|nr:hypothetical protein [Abyssisolibacter fermentans]